MALVPAWNKININGTELYCSSCGVPAEILASAGITSTDSDAPNYSAVARDWTVNGGDTWEWGTGEAAYNVMLSNNIALPFARVAGCPLNTPSMTGPTISQVNNMALNTLSSASFTLYGFSALSQGTTRPTITTISNLWNTSFTLDMRADVSSGYVRYTIPTIIPTRFRTYNTASTGITGYRYNLSYYTIDIITDSRGVILNAQATQHTYSWGQAAVGSTYTDADGYLALKMNSYTTE